MTRPVEEWIGATDATAAPQRVRARIKRRKSPLSIAHIKAWSIHDPITGCWNWQRAIARNGYGVLRDGAITKRAHRAAYELHTGLSLPRNVDVCHRCDNRACVNPDHLFHGSRKDNMQDCAAKGRIKLPLLSGESLTQSKLTADDVRLIRGSDLSQRALARLLGVDRAAIRFVRQGKTWRGVQ